MSGSLPFSADLQNPFRFKWSIFHADATLTLKHFAIWHVTLIQSLLAVAASSRFTCNLKAKAAIFLHFCLPWFLSVRILMMLQRRLMTSYQQQRITTSPEHIRWTHTQTHTHYIFLFKKKKTYKLLLMFLLEKSGGFLLFIFRSKEAYLLRYKGEGISALNICAYTNRL